MRRTTKRKKKNYSPLPKKAEHYLYLKYHEYSEGGEAEDSSDWPNYTDRHTDFTPTRLHIGETNWQETINVSFDPESYLGKKLFVVIVRYESGDTFGRSYGNWQLLSVRTTKEEVDEDKKTVQESVDLEFSKAYSLVQNRTGVSPNWLGYFERLESVEIYDMTLAE